MLCICGLAVNTGTSVARAAATQEAATLEIAWMKRSDTYGQFRYWGSTEDETQEQSSEQSIKKRTNNESSDDENGNTSEAVSREVTRKSKK